MCSVYKSATFATLFSVIKFNINTIILQDMELDTFAQKLRYLRLERNLNQHEFANLLNKISNKLDKNKSKSFGKFFIKWQKRQNFPNEVVRH